MLSYDSRSISAKVYENLSQLKQTVNNNKEAQKEQKTQLVEIYTYIATWGLLRLKAEESALENKVYKQSVIKCFFKTLEELVYPKETGFLCGKEALKNLSNKQTLGSSAYLGLTGIALQVSREFAFWAEALYPKEKPSNTTK